MSCDYGGWWLEFNVRVSIIINRSHRLPRPSLRGCPAAPAAAADACPRALGPWRPPVIAGVVRCLVLVRLSYIVPCVCEATRLNPAHVTSKNRLHTWMICHPNCVWTFTRAPTSLVKHACSNSGTYLSGAAVYCACELRQELDGTRHTHSHTIHHAHPYHLPGSEPAQVPALLLGGALRLHHRRLPKVRPALEARQ